MDLDVYSFKSISFKPQNYVILLKLLHQLSSIIQNSSIEYYLLFLDGIKENDSVLLQALDC